MFSADGSILYTSEQIADGSADRLGLWDTATYTRRGKVATGGIGPHDVRLLPNGNVIVANGGIQTAPTDRTKLNIATMQPNLATLSADGTLQDIITLDAALHQNSIRHLALCDGGVAFAMQWEGVMPPKHPPSLASTAQAQPLRCMPCPTSTPPP